MASDQFALQSSRPVSRLLYLWQLPVSLPVSAKPKSLTWQRRPLQPRQSIFGLSAWHFTCLQHYTMCTDNNHLPSSSSVHVAHWAGEMLFLTWSQQQLQTFKTVRENASAKGEKKRAGGTEINQDLQALSQAELLPSYRELRNCAYLYIVQQELFASFYCQ